MRRVAITGLGVVSPVGTGLQAFWNALTTGRTGFSPVASFDTRAYRSHVGAEVKDALPREAFAFALAASRQALEDAGAAPARLDKRRCGVALGTTLGEELKMEGACDLGLAGGKDWKAVVRAARPYFPGGVPARLARELGLAGPNIMLATACAAGNSALAYSHAAIASGRADLMLAGAADVFSPVLFSGFSRLLALAPEVCAPFSLGRRGLILGEGCGMLVLEDWESARARGRDFYAELLGWGTSSDAFHVTMPQEDGVARSIALCLSNSGLGPGDVDYISAHGTGTPANDRTETAAIKRVFGARAASVPVSSIKSMLGHAMGAASAFEAVACCLSLKTGLIPPTANFSGGDPDCDLDYVPGTARRTEPKVVLSNAFAFGGGNVVVALGSPDGARRPPPAREAPRVVVTGMGVVEEKDPVALAARLLPEQDLGFLDVPIAYALCAVKRALDAAGLSAGSLGERGGIVLDSSGELASHFRFYRDLVREGPPGVEPRLFPNLLANAAASRAAIIFGLKLANVTIAGSFPGGESALVWSYDFLRAAGSGVMLAGGIAQGAVVFAVETLPEALARGACILAEVRGYEESFELRAAPGRSPGCFCLAKAVRKVEKSGRPTTFQGRGLWGGRIGLSLGPALGFGS